MAPSYSAGIIPAMRYLETLAPNFIGKDPFKITSHLNPLLYNVFSRPGLVVEHVVSALDMAFLDIKGKDLEIIFFDQFK